MMKGSCKSLVELEFFLEEVYKATTDQLDWNNPEGQQYPHNLLKPLPLIPNSRGRCVIPFDHFIKNDLEYLCGGTFSRKYTTSVTKTKATDYGHIKWIKDLVPRIMWSQEPSTGSLLEMSTQNVESSLSPNFRSSNGIITRIWIGSLDYDKLYKFKEGDFKRLRIQDIEDMLLLLVQGKLTNHTVEERFAFNVSLRMFMRTIVIQRRVQDLQLGVESYQKKLNLINPNTDGTLNDVRTALDDRLKGIRMKYLPQAIWRKSDKERAAAMIQAIDKQLKTRRIMRCLEKFVEFIPFFLFKTHPKLRFDFTSLRLVGTRPGTRLIMSQNRATLKTMILIHMIHRVLHNNIFVVKTAEFPVIHQLPQEMSIQEMEDLKQQYLDEMKCLINSEYRGELKIEELKGNFNSMSIEINKKEKLQQLEHVANLST
nr:hypothetical protein [Tanacetum cinerariifolium]